MENKKPDFYAVVSAIAKYIEHTENTAQSKEGKKEIKNGN